MTGQLHIHEIAPPVDLPPSVPGIILLGGMAVIILVGAYFYYARLRASTGSCMVSVPAGEIALGALDNLLSEGLSEHREVKAFYQRITEILRHYIRDHLGLSAPGQTTREFLASLSAGTLLEPSHKELLRTLLTHCDLVKFAEYEPSAGEI